MQQPKSGEYMTKIFCTHNLSVLFLTKLFFFQLVLPEYLLHLLINLLFLLSGEWFSLLINVPLIIYHIHRLETFLCHCMHTEISTYSLLGQCNFYPRAFSVPAVKTLSSTFYHFCIGTKFWCVLVNRKSNCTDASLFPDIAPAQWCQGQAFMIPRASWTLTCWPSVRERAGSLAFYLLSFFLYLYG